MMIESVRDVPDFEDWMPSILKDDSHRYSFFKALDRILENLDKVDSVSGDLINSGIMGYGLSLSNTGKELRSALKVMLGSLVIPGEDFMEVLK